MSKIPDLDLLRALVHFSELGTLERVAQRLGLSQPTLTYQLRTLEAQAGGSVFELHGKKKWLTPFGRQLAAFAAREIARLDETYGELRNEYSDPSRQVLRLGCRRDRFARVGASLDFPGRLELTNQSAREALDALLAGHLDVAITHDRTDLPDLVVRKIFTSSHVFVAHSRWLRGMDLAKAARDPRFLRETPCLAYSEDDVSLRAWFARAGLKRGEIEPKVLCEDWEALIQFAAQGFGYALVPDDLLGGTDSSLKRWAVPEDELPTLSFFAIYHRELRRRMGAFKWRESSGPARRG